MANDIKVGIAYPAFFSSFKDFYPQLETIKSSSQVENFDLVIFSGGSDINPEIYGERNTYSGAIDKKRDGIETEMFHYATGLGKQILGVCRGHQLINVLLGGNLYQDIFLCTGKAHIHSGALTFSDGSVLGKFFSKVNSMHHQAIRSLGNIFPTSSVGNIIESLESRDKKIITTQFHPEFMGESSRLFFNYLLELTRNNMSESAKEIKKRIIKKSPETTAFDSPWLTPTPELSESYRRAMRNLASIVHTDENNSEESTSEEGNR
jgi:putative glutamine amidotransferase